LPYLPLHSEKIRLAKWEKIDFNAKSWTIPGKRNQHDGGRLNLSLFMSCRTKRRALYVNRCGWRSDAYVFPDATLKKDFHSACFPSGKTGQAGRNHNPARKDFP
jgi:hypothetical protein